MEESTMDKIWKWLKRAAAVVAVVIGFILMGRKPKSEDIQEAKDAVDAQQDKVDKATEAADKEREDLDNEVEKTKEKTEEIRDNKADRDKSAEKFFPGL